jgi:hypothetical protein
MVLQVKYPLRGPKGALLDMFVASDKAGDVKTATYTYKIVPLGTSSKSACYGRTIQGKVHK